MHRTPISRVLAPAGRLLIGGALLASLAVSSLAPVAAQSILPPDLSFKHKLAINDASVLEGNAGTRAATFTVTLTPGLNPPPGDFVTVEFETVAGTASAGGDYVAQGKAITPNAQLEFNLLNPSDRTRTIKVTILSDTLDEANEQFTLRLLNPSSNAALVDAEGQGTILDDDPLPTVSIGSAAPILEGNVGPNKLLTFPVTLSHPIGEKVTVAFNTADLSPNPGAATAGVDYLATPSGSLSIPAGATAGAITVPVIRDLADEGDESLFVFLTGAQNAVVGVNQGAGTIRDDDPFPTMVIADSQEIEPLSGVREMVFTVTLAHPVGDDVTATVATADPVSGPAATTDVDYERVTNGQLRIAAGTSGQVRVKLKADAPAEPDEFFRVLLSNPVNAVIQGAADGEALGRIVDLSDLDPCELNPNLPPCRPLPPTPIP
jgi:hypothetical protein